MAAAKAGANISVLPGSASACSRCGAQQRVHHDARAPGDCRDLVDGRLPGAAGQRGQAVAARGQRGRGLQLRRPRDGQPRTSRAICRTCAPVSSPPSISPAAASRRKETRAQSSIQRSRP